MSGDNKTHKTKGKTKMENRGIISEVRGKNLSHAIASDNKAYDYQNKKGTVKTENKHLTIEKAENYKEKKAIYNSAHAHGWVLNKNGEKDYLLTVKAMTEESDRVRVTTGATGKEKAEYLTKYADRYNFYFCRLQWQNEKNGRLCTNPVSTKCGGRRRQLETLKANGVVNVPTFEEIEKAYNN